MVISIHALREEGDISPEIVINGGSNFYPRPPRGGRRKLTQAITIAEGISIHALREEGDIAIILNSVFHLLFLSTPSARRATRPLDKISIFRNDFYPRPPRGGRPAVRCIKGNCQEFLSTPSARRATVSGGQRRSRCPISIHALREEGDSPGTTSSAQIDYFYPRPPRGGRPALA